VAGTVYGYVTPMLTSQQLRLGVGSNSVTNVARDIKSQVIQTLFSTGKQTHKKKNLDFLNSLKSVGFNDKVQMYKY
jgi:hypothetical protein